MLLPTYSIPPQDHASAGMAIGYSVVDSDRSHRLTRLAAIGLQPHDLVKTAEVPTVFYIGQDGKKHPFPNEYTYRSWYDSFSSVRTIKTALLDSVVLGQAITVRPGKRLMRFGSDPKVYLMTVNGALRWIRTEAIANMLLGADWTKHIDVLPDAARLAYSFGADIQTQKDVSPQERFVAGMNPSQFFDR